MSWFFLFFSWVYGNFGRDSDEKTCPYKTENLPPCYFNAVFFKLWLSFFSYA